MIRSRDVGLNCLFIRRLWLVMKTMSRPWTPAFLILLVIVPASFVEQVAIYYMGLVPSGFYKVLENRDEEGFYHQLWTAVWWVLAIVLIKSSKTYAAGALYIQWRWNLTEALHIQYFSNKLYYDLNCLNSVIDNPDMRITQDVDKLTETLQSIILQIVVFPGVVIYYTYKCWDTMGYLGPVCIYGYFLVACVLNKFLMSPIVAEVFRLERKEGHFRYIHVNLRTSAESAAFSDAELVEHGNFQATLLSILASKQKIINKQLLLNMAVNTSDYIGAILSYIILAIPIFGGMYDGVTHLGSVISQNSFVTMYLVSSFSTLVDMSGKLADLAGYTHRVGEMLEFMNNHQTESLYWNPTAVNRADKKDPGSNESRESDPGSESERAAGEKERFITSGVVEEVTKITSATSGVLKLRNITVSNPVTNKFLVQNLSISLNEHTNVLIHGPPAAGKSSVLRIIKSLWEPMVGSIESAGDILFLPQRPYFSRQCLAAQITLPDTPRTSEETVMLEILETLKLTEVLDDTLWEEEVDGRKGYLHDVINKTTDDLKPGEGTINSDEVETGSHPQQHSTSFLRKLLSLSSLPLHSPSPLFRTPRHSWHKLLSPGKQQLLAFARVLYHKPKVVILDEATSAVSPELAGLMYDLLKSLGVCYLSVSHDEALEQFHDKVVVLKGDGKSWSFKDTKVTRCKDE